MSNERIPTPDTAILRLAPGITVAKSALSFSASRSGGPGGQNVNNTSSKIEVRLSIAEIRGMTRQVHDRLVRCAGQRLNALGELVLSCDETASQRTNRLMVIERLENLLLEASTVPLVRKRTRPGRGAIERRLEGKAQRSQTLRERRHRDD